MVHNVGIQITNMRQFEAFLQKHDMSKNKPLQTQIRKALKEPFEDFKRDSKRNLNAMMTSSPVSQGTLSRGLSVSSRYKKTKGFSVAFGGRGSGMLRYREKTGKGNKSAMNHFHLVNSGTANRYTKKGYFRGAVGKRRVYWEGFTNLAYKTGFADDAIKSRINSLERRYVSSLNRVFNGVKV